MQVTARQWVTVHICTVISEICGINQAGLDSTHRGIDTPDDGSISIDG